MDVNQICKKIYDFVLPYTEKTQSPIAYVNLEVGFSVDIPENEMWECFNKISWDTPLSSAELFILKKTYTGTSKDDSIKIISLSVFEDDGKSTPLIPIKDGLIV